MADRLTQLQDCFDQLATQFYASLRYISTHHPPSSFPSSTQTASAPPPPDPSSSDAPAPRPDSPSTFAAAQRELAHDLVRKEQQIEYLISVLPGIGTSEKEQEERIRALEGEVREVEEERKGAVREKEECLERLDEVIRGVRRV